MSPSPLPPSLQISKKLLDQPTGTSSIVDLVVDSAVGFEKWTRAKAALKRNLSALREEESSFVGVSRDTARLLELEEKLVTLLNYLQVRLVV
jgi:hypothetical protein